MAKLVSSLGCDVFVDRRRWHSIACDASHLAARCSRYADRQLFILDGVSMTDKSMTGTFQIKLPKDLVSESRRQPKPKNEQLKVEGFRTSWFSRVSELLIGKD
jgi:hypothetical protein